MTDENVWDLSVLVEKEDPEWIKGAIDKVVEKAKEINSKYKGKIKNASPEFLLSALQELDKLRLESENPILYSRMRFSANQTDPIGKDLNDYADNAMMKIGQYMTFFELELGKLLKDKPEIVNEPVLSEYKHYLEKIAKEVPFQLSEVEEQLIIEKDRFGIDAWSQLQSQWLSTRMFEIEIDGEKKVLPYGEIIGYYMHPDRDLRKRAYSTVYTKLGEDHIIWSSALRAVCSDHMMQVKRRGYPSPMYPSLLANDVDQETIDSLIKTILDNVGFYRKYLKLKAKLLGLKKLGNWDILAPLPDSEITFDWKKAREFVEKAYSGFDDEFAVWIKEMFDKRHIDGAVRVGKQSGAWCAPWLSGKSAWILLSFTGKLGDVYTLAHENGHAMHDYLMARNQVPTNCEPGACIAETGSITGELLLTDLLLENAKDNKEKVAILCHVLDEFGMAAFQVSARVLFEQSLYDAIAKGEFLDGEKISELWVKARDTIYGDAVEWLPEMKWEWTMKPHYYIPRFRFYNYPYVYAQLFVFALYQKYKEEGKEFVPKLKKILAAGSSKSPRDLALEIGFDVADPKFWSLGIKQAETLLKELENLIK